MNIVFLLVHSTCTYIYIWVLFFTHTPFMVNCIFNAMPTKRLQQHPFLFIMNHTDCTFFLWKFFHESFSWFMCPKMKLFAVKLRHILEVFHLEGIQKKFWAHIHDLYVQKRSCVLWSYNAFWKLSACKVYRKNSGHIFTIYVSKNEAVCYEVQMRCDSTTVLARFARKILGAFSRFMHPKTWLFAVKLRSILEVIRLQGLQKEFWVHFYNLCVQKRSILRWSSDAFWKFFPWMVYKKKFWAHSHDLCMRKQSCLLWCLNAFGKFLPCKVYETCSGRIFTIPHVHKSLLCCSVPLWSPWLCILLKCLESGHILSTSAPTNCSVQAGF